MRHRLLALFVFVLLSAPAHAAAPDVLATIKPVHSLVAAVMDGIGTPHLLIKAAASQHTYVLKPSDARKIADARIVFWVGPDLETFLTTPLSNLAPGADIVALEHAPGVHLLEARPGGLWHVPLHRSQGRRDQSAYLARSTECDRHDPCHCGDPCQSRSGACRALPRQCGRRSQTPCRARCAIGALC